MLEEIQTKLGKWKLHFITGKRPQLKYRFTVRAVRMIHKITLTSLSESGQSANHQSFSYLQNTKPFHQSVLLNVKGHTSHVYRYLHRSGDEPIPIKHNSSETKTPSEQHYSNYTEQQERWPRTVWVNQVYWALPALSSAPGQLQTTLGTPHLGQEGGFTRKNVLRYN